MKLEKLVYEWKIEFVIINNITIVYKYYDICKKKFKNFNIWTLLKRF